MNLGRIQDYIDAFGAILSMTSCYVRSRSRATRLRDVVLSWASTRITMHIVLHAGQAFLRAGVNRGGLMPAPTSGVGTTGPRDLQMAVYSYV